MRDEARAAALAMALGWGACGPSVSVEVLEPEAGSGGSVPEEPSEQGARGGADAFEHPTSGARFPVTVGGLERTSTRCFDAELTDCSAHYDGGLARVSIFIYPVRPEMRGRDDAGAREFRAALRVVAEHAELDEGGLEGELVVEHERGDALRGPAFTGVAWLVAAEGDLATVTKKATSTGGKVVYDPGRENARLVVPRTTQLFVTVRDGWYVKYRVTFRAERDPEEALGWLRGIVSTAPLPSRPAASGATEAVVAR